MLTTLGSMPTSLPPGMLCAVRFPVLMRLDTFTGDGRIFDSEGAGSRELPLSIRMQHVDSYGHDGAVVTGALHEVTIDPEGTVLSGRGFLLDNEEGRKHALYAVTKSMKGNSADLADISARWEMDMDSYDEWVRFTKFNLAATTGVCVPAFKDATMEVTSEILAAACAGIDEIMASIAANPMDEVVCEFETFDIHIDVTQPGQDIPPELLASMSATKMAYAAFHRPEAEVPHKIIVDEAGHVFGHLALWNSCHSGDLANCIMAPRPADGYASFNKPGVLTERGIVETGPIFAYGGHRRSKGQPTLDEAYGGIENAWADVRLTEGIHGPWISGVVRPGVEDTVVYAARASRISGHWLSGKLKAIVSVNVEAFEVPGTGPVDVLPELAAGFAFRMDEAGVVAELVASFPGCADPEPTAAESIEVKISIDEEALRAALQQLADGGNEVAAGLVEEMAATGSGDDDDEEQTTILLGLLLDDDNP